MTAPSDNRDTTSFTRADVPNFCLGCGCCCDDVRWWVEKKGASEKEEIAWVAEPRCVKASSWIAELAANDVPANDVPANGRRQEDGPRCFLNGENCSPTDAIHRATELLAEAQHPLVCGFAALPTEEQRHAVRFGQAIHATIDWTESPAEIESLLSLQRSGRVTCTFGEIKNRADLVVIWDLDLDKDAPRFAQRFIPAHCPHVIVNRPDGSPSIDQVSAAPSRRHTLLNALRVTVEGHELDPQDVVHQGCISGDTWQHLRSHLEDATHPVFVIDSAKANWCASDLSTLTKVINGLNRRKQARLVDLSMRDNSHGAENVLTWLTGYPLAVRFLANRDPEYDPFRFSTSAMLNRQANDLTVTLGDLKTVALEPSAQRHLLDTPWIRIGRGAASTATEPDVDINIDGPLWNRGTIFRPDGVPLLLPDGGLDLHSGPLAGLLRQILVELNERSAG